MDILLRLFVAFVATPFLAWIVFFAFGLVTTVVNLIAFGIGKLLRAAFGIKANSWTAWQIVSSISELARTLCGLFLGLAVFWVLYISFALDTGPDLYPMFSMIAAIIAVFVWAPTALVWALLTGDIVSSYEDQP